MSLRDTTSHVLLKSGRIDGERGHEGRVGRSD